MFKLSGDKNDFFAACVEYYNNSGIYSNEALIPKMLEDGLIMNVYGISRYVGFSMSQGLEFLSVSKLTPVIETAVPYYLRTDVWDILPAATEFLRELNKHHTRVKSLHDLVDSCDIALYFGIKVGKCRNLLISYPVDTIAIRNSPTLFYKEQDILKLRKDYAFNKFLSDNYYPISVTPYQLKLIPKSKKQIKTEVKEAVDMFRDHLCPQYTACTALSFRTTDYMDCSKCVHHWKRSGFVPSLEAFDPRKVFVKPRSTYAAKFFPEGFKFPNDITLTI